MKIFKNSKGFTAQLFNHAGGGPRLIAEKPPGGKRSAGGFTLVELLVVIAIIGILSSVILVSLQSTRAKSRDARRLTDIKQIQNAIELYRDANKGAAPPTASYATDLAPYIASLPADPFTGTTYNYARDTGTGRTDTAQYRIQFETETDTAIGLVGVYCATSIDIFRKGGTGTACDTTTDAK